MPGPLEIHGAPVSAGARTSVLSEEDGAAIGLAIGAGVAFGMLILHLLISPWWWLLGVFVFGAIGYRVGLEFMRRTFPPLELVEAWERTRWQRAKATFWQTLVFALGVLGIVVSILLSST